VSWMLIASLHDAIPSKLRIGRKPMLLRVKEPCCWLANEKSRFLDFTA